MHVNYDTLKKLQVVLKEMFELEDRKKEIPMDLNDKEAVLQKSKIDYLELHNKFEDITKEVEDLWAKYEETGKNRELKEKEMENTTVPRECENLLKEIEDSKVVEQNILRSYNSKKKYLTETEAKLQTISEILTIQEQEVAEETAKKDVQIAEVDKLIAEKRVQCDELSKDLPENLLFKFERIIRNKGGVGVVPIHGIICQGCHMELPQQFANEVRRATIDQTDDIHFCPYCSRVLYYEESEEDENITTEVYGDIHEEEEDVAAAASNDFFGGDENLLED